MSAYGMNKVCYLLQMDAEFRERVLADPSGALADMPLRGDEYNARMRTVLETP